MIRYLRLYAYFLRFSFSRAMAFRLDFYFRILMDLFYYAINIAFFKIIFLHAPALAGWTEPQVMVFVSGYLLVDAINMTVFSNNLWVLPSYVNKGDLDYYLLRPVSSLFFLSFRDFAASSFVNLIMAAGIMLWALAAYPGELSWDRLLVFLFLLLNGTALYYFLRLLSVLPVFWTQGRGWDMLFWHLTRFMERPDAIFKGWLRAVLLTAVPFSLMASFPARALFEGSPWPIILHAVGVSFVFFFVVLGVWRLALRSYSSASS